MKLLAAFLALVTLALVPSALRADTISATVDTGFGNQTISPVSKNGAEVFTFTTYSTNLLAISLETVTATYTDLTGSLGQLNVTKSCAAVTTFFGYAAPCKSLSFSFTDSTLGDISAGTLLGLTGSVKGDVATLNFNGNLGSASASYNFSNASSPSNSPVPEPATLSLMATGLLGAAGALRRRFATAS